MIGSENIDMRMLECILGTGDNVTITLFRLADNKVNRTRTNSLLYI